MTIKDSALKWWAEKTKEEQYVATADEIPDQRQRQFLVKQKLLHPIIKGYWVLKKPEDSIEEVFPLLYWEIVELILAKYNWAVKGASALAILNGEQKAQKNLLVNTKEKTNRYVSLINDYKISISYNADFDERLVKKISVADKKIPVDIPEKVLIDISRTKLNADIRNFIAGTKFNLRVSEALYADSPKPIVFKRLVRLAKEIKRPDLVVGFESIIDVHTHYAVGKKEKVAPEYVGGKTVALRPPWVIRQEQQIQEFESILTKQFTKDIKSLHKYSIKQLLEKAKEHKKHDTYHSTTLEGYRITPEEVDILLSGNISKDKEDQGESIEKVKNRMAIVGYSEAFDFVIKNAKSDFSKANLNEKLIQDTYYHLFKPSADAGIVDYLTLTSYRNIPAYIKGTLYVPPSYEKLTELMASYESIINKIENPIIKAILAHYLFVTIHPYIDGNGRTARLLMNYLLLTNGYPWITIRADERIEYFSAIKKAQLENDILSFGTSIIRMLKSASNI